MVKTSHTQGPWVSYQQADSTGYIVATKAKDGFGRRKEDVARATGRNAEDDARLLSASPDAERILRHLLEYVEAGEPTIHFDGLMPDDGYDGATDEQTLADAVRAYFAKIEGR